MLSVTSTVTTPTAIDGHNRSHFWQDQHAELHEACGGGGRVQKGLTLEDFYASDPQRVAAPEVPYGSLWREFAPVPTYRLAWVPTTGELYAMELSEPDQAKDPVEVLGVLWSRPQVEACLAGWSERCGDQRSLLWARDQIARWRPLVEEAQVTLAPPEPARQPTAGVLADREPG